MPSAFGWCNVSGQVERREDWMEGSGEEIYNLADLNYTGKGFPANISKVDVNESLGLRYGTHLWKDL